MLRIIAFAILGLATPVAGQSAGAAAQADLYEKLFTQTPNPALLWLIAEARAEAGQNEQAIAALRLVADRKLGFVVTADSPLKRLAGNAEFDRIVARLEAEFPKVHRARDAFTVSTRGVIPEGVAAAPGSRRLFLSDLAKKRVLLVGSGVPTRVFASTDKLEPLGMKADTVRSLLWVAATSAFRTTDQPKSRLLAFDLRNGKLRHSYSSPDLKSLNDLALTPNGDLYVTDSLGGSVFRLRRGSDRLERITEAGKMSYPNGIAASGDGRSIYVAQGISLRRIDTATGQVSTVAQPPDLAILSIDGLYWHDGSLIGIQNGGNRGRVLRMRLSSQGESISGFDVLEAGNPDFDMPTTGSIAGNRFIFMANTQLQRLQDNGRISDGPPLKPVKLLEIRLPRERHSDRDEAS